MRFVDLNLKSDLHLIGSWSILRVGFWKKKSYE